MAASALIYHFRDALGDFLSTSWAAIKGEFLSVPWGSAGMAIADAMTFGLARKLPAVKRGILGIMSRASAAAPTVTKAAPYHAQRFVLDWRLAGRA